MKTEPFSTSQKANLPDYNLHQNSNCTSIKSDLQKKNINKQPCENTLNHNKVLLSIKYKPKTKIVIHSLI